MKRVMILILAFATLTTGAGCAKKKGSVAADAPPVVCDRGLADCGGVGPGAPGGGGSGGPIEYGADTEVPLALEGGLARLKQFFFQSPVYNPQNLRIGMVVGDEGNGGYGGEVWVSFEDNGRTRSAVLSTSHPHYTGVSDSSKNVWFQNPANGETVWHGLFQDVYGSVVVVIDDALNLGDGSPSELVGGSIWFQNFGYTMAPQGPMKMCWQISIGPYDCRTFLVGSKVVTTSSLYPTTYGDGDNSIPARKPYVKLGEFYGMPRAAAMGD